MLLLSSPFFLLLAHSPAYFPAVFVKLSSGDICFFVWSFFLGGVVFPLKRWQQRKVTLAEGNIHQTWRQREVALGPEGDICETWQQREVALGPEAAERGSIRA